LERRFTAYQWNLCEIRTNLNMESYLTYLHPPLDTR
jgi:hypothetical protein